METFGALVTELMTFIAVIIIIVVWEWRYSQLKKAQKKHWEKIIDLAQTTDRIMAKFQRREVEVDNLLNAQTELIRSVVTNRQRTEEKIGLLDKQIDEIIKTVTTLANSEAEFKNSVKEKLEGFKGTLHEMSSKQSLSIELIKIIKDHEDRIMVLELSQKAGASVYMNLEEWSKLIEKEKERIKAETSLPDGEESGPFSNVDSKDQKEVGDGC